jgi:hypothetical protein
VLVRRVEVCEREGDAFEGHQRFQMQSGIVDLGS